MIKKDDLKKEITDTVNNTPAFEIGYKGMKIAIRISPEAAKNYPELYNQKPSCKDINGDEYGIRMKAKVLEVLYELIDLHHKI